MGIEIRRKPPKGIRKHFRKDPKRRSAYYAGKKSKEIPVQGRPGIIAVGKGAEDIRVNLRIAIRNKLESFPKSIVDVVMELNEAIYTIRRDDAREYERIRRSAIRGRHPGAILFTNLFTAGRKGDTEAVREICSNHLASLKVLKKKIKEGKIRLVDEVKELVKAKVPSTVMWTEVYDDMLERERHIKYVRSNPKQFSKAVQIAFSVDFSPEAHTLPKERLQ